MIRDFGVVTDDEAKAKVDLAVLNCLKTYISSRRPWTVKTVALLIVAEGGKVRRIS